MKHWDCVPGGTLGNYWGVPPSSPNHLYVDYDCNKKEISGLVSEAGCEPEVLPIRTYTGRLRSGHSAEEGCLFQVSDIGKGSDFTTTTTTT